MSCAGKKVHINAFFKQIPQQTQPRVRHVKEIEIDVD